jgi:hypothetical protein
MEPKEAAMSTDFSIKPVGASVAAPVVQPAPEAARQAVPTQLPASQSVTASGAAASANLTPGYIPLDDVAHDVVVDDAAATIVYRDVNTATNQVISQYPDQSRLRARAYFRTLDASKLAAKSLATDRRI